MVCPGSGIGDAIFCFFNDIFGSLGSEGLLLTIFAVFFVDSTLFPLVPEAFVIFFYSFQTPLSLYGPFGWALLILVIVVVAELAANASLYWIVKRKEHRIPHFVKRAMNRWRGLLLLQDERAILLNRVVPIMPFMGAFIAVSPWNARRAMGFVVLGGSAKYAALLVLVGSLHLNYDASQVRQVTLFLIVALVLWALLSSYIWKRRHVDEVAKEAPARAGWPEDR